MPVNAGKLMVLTSTDDASQKSGFFASTYSFGLNDFSTKGPETTGFVLVNVTGFDTDDHTDFGTIGVSRIDWANGTSGAVNVKVIVEPLEVTDDT